MIVMMFARAFCSDFEVLLGLRQRRLKGIPFLALKLLSQKYKWRQTFKRMGDIIYSLKDLCF